MEPGIQKWPGNSFTFHAWVCLDPVEIKERNNLSMERKIFHYRRNLYRQESEVNPKMHNFLAGNIFIKKLIYRNQVSTQVSQALWAPST